LKAISPQASWSRARWFSSFFDQRISRARFAVDPGVAGFDDPAAGAPARRVRLLLELLAAAADVRRQLVVGDDLA
jgi:hypothetical protein